VLARTSGRRPYAALAAAGLVVVALAGCTGDDAGTPAAGSRPSTPASAGSSSGGPSSSGPSSAEPSSDPSTTRPTTEPSAEPSADPAAGLGGPGVRPDDMLATVRLLAGRIGPREATSDAFAQAAEVVARRLAGYGYEVTRQRFRVPAGLSWGVPVDAGASLNVVATPAGLDRTAPHRIVGAHLDTVPQAPGAEDNASGIAVLLDVARLAARTTGPGTALPTVFIGFGAEEPRGEGDALHHFGSTAHVRRLSPAQLRAVRGMVSLDRVGTGTVVPVCTGGLSPLRVRDDLLATARRAGIAAAGCTDNTASDHWSYEKAGVPAARVGGTPYAAYHSAADLPGVPQRAQLRRVAELTWAWLRG